MCTAAHEAVAGGIKPKTKLIASAKDGDELREGSDGASPWKSVADKALCRYQPALNSSLDSWRGQLCLWSGSSASLFNATRLN